MDKEMEKYDFCPRVPRSPLPSSSHRKVVHYENRHRCRSESKQRNRYLHLWLKQLNLGPKKHGECKAQT